MTVIYVIVLQLHLSSFDELNRVAIQIYSLHIEQNRNQYSLFKITLIKTPLIKSSDILDELFDNINFIDKIILAHIEYIII